MNKPDFLPDRFYNVYFYMRSEGKITPDRERFFSEPKLKKFWIKANSYIESIESKYQIDAASWLIAICLTDTELGKAGKANSPSLKTLLISNQHKADELMVKAAKQANVLAATLVKIQDITGYYPDELDFLGLIEKTISIDEKLESVSSYYQSLPTSSALFKLKEGLCNYQKANELFKSIPILSSQKASYTDWLKAINLGIKRMHSAYGVSFEIAEIDWIVFINTRRNENLSRDNIKAALKRAEIVTT